MKSPYFYIIKHLPSEKYYAGCKINSQSDSSNLMTENGYKTTSKIVKELIKKDGLASFQILKIKHFETKAKALFYESRFLQKVNAAENLKFLNLHNGGKNFVNKGGYKLSECTKNKMRKPKSIETVQKQNEQKRNRPKEVYQKMVQTRKSKNPNWHNEEVLKLIKSKNATKWKNEKDRKEQSDRMKEYYKNNPVSEDTRKKLKLANSRENNNMFGKKHTDLTKEKMKLAWAKRKENKKIS